MIYEENMKIGFLGGTRSGKSKSYIADQCSRGDLKWLIFLNKPFSNGFQSEIKTSMAPEFIKYKLMILKKDGAMKFFYILDGMGRDEIKTQIELYWDKSDILGYDFD